MTRTGFKGPHTEETREKIRSSLKGRRPKGFEIKVPCSFCQIHISKPNLKRHEIACDKLYKSRHVFPNGLGIRAVKSFRRCLMQYKISIDDYVLLHDSQEGKCKICLLPPGNKKRLFVDHCHVSKKVRGLICYHCNTLLGMCKDNPKILENAIQYLKDRDE